MRFYSDYEDEEETRKFLYPCVILKFIEWDDYGHRTKFEVIYYRNSQDYVKVGLVKILGPGEGKTKLKPSFNKLTTTFCSLGQNPGYYRKLKDELSGKWPNSAVFGGKLFRRFAKKRAQNNFQAL